MPKLSYSSVIDAVKQLPIIEQKRLIAETNGLIKQRQDNIQKAQRLKLKALQETNSTEAELLGLLTQMHKHE